MSLKILILLTYFNRPLLLRKALQSVLAANIHHQNWELVLGDDNSLISGKPILEEVLRDHLPQVQYLNTGTSLEEKLTQGISIGKFANEIMSKSSADLVITLSDDDELVPSYLRGLSDFFEASPQVMYAYSKVYLFNPLTGTKQESLVGHYNQYEGPINPVHRLDTCQVAFRLDCYRVFGVRYPEQLSLGNNLDAALFQSLFEQFGSVVPTGLVGQYKGVHDFQLVWHKKSVGEDLRNYIKQVEQFAGLKF